MDVPVVAVPKIGILHIQEGSPFLYVQKSGINLLRFVPVFRYVDSSDAVRAVGLAAQSFLGCLVCRLASLAIR